MKITVRKTGQRYQVITTDVEDRQSLFGVYATRDLAVQAWRQLEKINEGAAYAVEISNGAVQQLQRAAGLPHREAVELLLDTLGSWRRPA